MIASERKLFILRYLKEQGVINLKEIAQSLNISETTVRRDFEKLEKEGKLTRVQGGAMLNANMDDMVESVQPTMSVKKNINRDEKRIVAERAALLVNDGDSVFIDCGTTMVPLGEILLKRRIRIVTNNTLLLSHSNRLADVILVGGQLDSQNSLTHGPLAKQMVDGFHFSHAFIGCFGLSLVQQKAYTLEMESADVKTAAIANATQCHLLCDQTKIERNGFYAFADFSAFNTIFCDKADNADNLPENFVLA